jgi:hypothetical protein
MPTSDRTIKWIENLADQERSISQGERGGVDLFHTKEEILSVETTVFVRELAYQLNYLAKLFNNRVAEPSLQIRVQTSPDLPDSIVLTRNSLRLNVTRCQAGVVQIQCDKIISKESSSGFTLNGSSVMFSGTIEANFETFHDVKWYFLGAPIEGEQVARHYLTEFLQVSRGNPSA